MAPGIDLVACHQEHARANLTFPGLAVMIPYAKSSLLRHSHDTPSERLLWSFVRFNRAGEVLVNRSSRSKDLKRLSISMAETGLPDVLYQ
jgi:hypothetical protein